MRKFQLICLFLLILMSSSCIIVPVPVPLPLSQITPPDKAANYGEKVSYAEGAPIRFPDFELTYLGMRHEKSDKFPPGFTYYDFRIISPEATLIVAWTSGTGAIGPALFTFGGYGYQLERVYSDELGRLADNEIVVWQEGFAIAPTPEISENQDIEATLDQPFDLHQGQRATIPAAQLAIEFDTVSADSRCPLSEGDIVVTCAWVGEALVELTLVHDDEPGQSVTLSTYEGNRHTPSATVAGYTITLLELQPQPTTLQPEVPQADYVASLIVAEARNQQTLVPTPTVEPTPHYEVVIEINCDRVEPGDAEAILGEPVANDSVLLNFFCVYGSVARSDQPAPADFPIYLGDFANRQVVATTQWGIGDEPDPLFDLAERIRAANPSADDTPYYKLQTYMAAGLFADAFDQLPALAEGAENLSVQRVDDLGEGAAWLWQTLPDGRHFAALVAVTGGKYVVLYALVNPERTEAAAYTGALALAKKLDQ